MSEDDLTARVAELAALIETSLAKDEAVAAEARRAAPPPWFAANSLLLIRDADGTTYGTDVAEVTDYRYDAVLTHAARNDPARRLRDVKATRDLVAVILAEPHYTAVSAYFSCSHAQEGAYLIGGPTGPPGSGCGDPERAGRPCDCGRDAKVARMLGIIAGEWEVDGHGG